MYRQYDSSKRYFPTYQSNVYVNGNSALRVGAPQSTLSTDKHIESRIVYGQGSPQYHGYEQPPFLTTSSGITELNQRVADDNNLMEYRRSSSKRRRKIFDNSRSAYSLNRNSQYSVESDKNWLKRSENNFMHYNNPISSKLSHRSRSRSRERNHQHKPIFPQEKKYPVQSKNPHLKGPVLFSYSNPQMQVYKPTTYQVQSIEPNHQSTLRNLMKQPMKFKSTQFQQNMFEESKTAKNPHFHSFAPYQQEEMRREHNFKKSTSHSKENLLETHAPKISAEKLNRTQEENYDQDCDRFFDMDFKINSRKKQSIRELNQNFLSPLKIKPEVEKPQANYLTELANKLKKLFTEADGEGKLISIVLILLGILLVLFQASK